MQPFGECDCGGVSGTRGVRVLIGGLPRFGASGIMREREP